MVMLGATSKALLSWLIYDHRYNPDFLGFSYTAIPISSAYPPIDIGGSSLIIICTIWTIANADSLFYHMYYTAGCGRTCEVQGSTIA